MSTSGSPPPRPSRPSSSSVSSALETAAPSPSPSSQSRIGSTKTSQDEKIGQQIAIYEAMMARQALAASSPATAVSSSSSSSIAPTAIVSSAIVPTASSTVAPTASIASSSSIVSTVVAPTTSASSLVAPATIVSPAIVSSAIVSSAIVSSYTPSSSPPSSSPASSSPASSSPSHSRSSSIHASFIRIDSPKSNDRSVSTPAPSHPIVVPAPTHIVRSASIDAGWTTIASAPLPVASVVLIPLPSTVSPPASSTSTPTTMTTAPASSSSGWNWLFGSKKQAEPIAAKSADAAAHSSALPISTPPLAASTSIHAPPSLPVSLFPPPLPVISALHAAAPAPVVRTIHSDELGGVHSSFVQDLVRYSLNRMFGFLPWEDGMEEQYRDVMCREAVSLQAAVSAGPFDDESSCPSSVVLEMSHFYPLLPSGVVPRLPCILIRTPYDRALMRHAAERICMHGYHVITQDTRNSPNGTANNRKQQRSLLEAERLNKMIGDQISANQQQRRYAAAVAAATTTVNALVAAEPKTDDHASSSSASEPPMSAAAQSRIIAAATAAAATAAASGLPPPNTIPGESNDGGTKSNHEFFPVVHEANDGISTIDWIVKQSWCDGNISFYGASYLGITAYSVVNHRHPALKCMAPIVAASNLYGVLYPGGVLNLDLAARWLFVMFHPTVTGSDDIQSSVPNFFSRSLARVMGNRSIVPAALDHLPACELDIMVAERKLPFWREMIAAGGDPHHQFWIDKRTKLCDLENAPPLLIIEGWTDIFLKEALVDYTEALGIYRKFQSEKAAGKYSAAELAAMPPSIKTFKPYLTIMNSAHIDWKQLYRVSLVESIKWYDLHLKPHRYDTTATHAKAASTAASANDGKALDGFSLSSSSGQSSSPPVALSSSSSPASTPSKPASLSHLTLPSSNPTTPVFAGLTSPPSAFESGADAYLQNNGNSNRMIDRPESKSVLIQMINASQSNEERHTKMVDARKRNEKYAAPRNNNSSASSSASSSSSSSSSFSLTDVPSSPGARSRRRQNLLDAEWRWFSEFPPPGARDMSFYLHSEIDERGRKQRQLRVDTIGQREGKKRDEELHRKKGRTNSVLGDMASAASNLLSPQRALPSHLSISTASPADTSSIRHHSSFSYDPRDPTPVIGGTTFDAMNSGPLDNRPIESRSDVLVFTSAPLTAPLVVVGYVKCVLYVRSSSKTTDFIGRLLDVFPLDPDSTYSDRRHGSGKSQSLCDGLFKVTPAKIASITVPGAARNHRARSQSGGSAGRKDRWGLEKAGKPNVVSVRIDVMSMFDESSSSSSSSSSPPPSIVRISLVSPLVLHSDDSSLLGGPFVPISEPVEDIDEPLLKLEIDMWATGNVFQVGHCVRFHVCSSAHPRWLRSLGGADPMYSSIDKSVVQRQTVYHSEQYQSRLIIPVLIE